MSKTTVISWSTGLFILTLFWTSANFWSYGYVQIIAGQLGALLVGFAVRKV